MEKIGKYDVLEKIGVGGFGVVYKGRDPFIKRFVAIKTCGTEDEQIRQRFFREAEIAGNLQHRNVTTVYDFGFHGDVPYLVQEFLSGEDLDHYVKRKAYLSTEQKLDILLQVAAGLEYAHACGVIHRDIKPANVRLLEGGRVKIMDFGIAKLANEQSQLTRTGTTLGTAAYLAPEQIHGGAIDGRVDVFSYGVLAYELLTYKRPFEAQTISSLFYQILSVEPVPLEMVWGECPPKLAALVGRCLHKDAAERFATFTQVIAELQGVWDTAHAASSETRRRADGRDSCAWRGVRARRGELARVERRISELLGEGNATAAEIELTLARKRLGDAPGIDAAFRPLQRRIAEERSEHEEVRRRAEKIAALLERGRELESAGSFEEAALVLRTAADLDPEHREVSAALQRVDAAIERERRRASLQQAIERVEMALGEGELESAQTALEALDREHGAEAAAPVRERLESARRRAEAAAAVARAGELEASGDLDAALGELRRAARLDPDAARSLREATARIEAALERRRAEHERQERVAAAVARIEEALDRERYADATRQLAGAAAALGAVPELDSLRQRLDAALAQRRRAALERWSAEGERLLGAAQWQALRQHLDAPPEEIAAAEEVAALRRRAVEVEARDRRQKAEGHAADGAAAVEAGRLEEAVAAYRRALAIDPGFTAVQERLSAAERDLEQRRRAAERATALAAAVAEVEERLAAGDERKASRALARHRAALGAAQELDVLESALEQRRQAAEEARAEGRRRREAEKAAAREQAVAERQAQAAARAEQRRREEAEQAAQRERATAQRQRQEAASAEQQRRDEAEQVALHEREAAALAEEQQRQEAARAAARERRVAVRHAAAERRRQRLRDAAPMLRRGGAAAGALLVLAVAGFGWSRWHSSHPQPAPSGESAAQVPDAPITGDGAAPASSGAAGPVAPPNTVVQIPSGTTAGIAVPSGAARVAQVPSAPPAVAPPAASVDRAALARALQEARRGLRSSSWDSVLSALATAAKIDPADSDLQRLRDDTVEAARQRAEEARRRAEAAGADDLAAAAFGRAAGRRREADHALAAGRTADGVRGLIASAGLYDQARQEGESTRAEAARQASERQAAAAPVPEAPASAPPRAAQPTHEPIASSPAAAPPPQPARDDQAALLQLLESYRRAAEALDAAAVARTWPGVDRSRLERNYAELDALKMTLDGCQLRIDGAAATATCRMRQQVDPKAGRAVSNDQRVTFRCSRRRRRLGHPVARCRLASGRRARRHVARERAPIARPRTNSRRPTTKITPSSSRPSLPRL